MKIGGLCFGYGGLDLAVQSVIPDAELAWYAEFDKGASKIGAHRWPDVPNHGDMTQIDWSTVEPVDILTGGTPCQDLSHAGKRAGMTEGTRSNLWVAMREAIAQIRPGLVVWENVGGAASAAADSEVEPCAGCVGDGSGVHLRALGRVVGDLSSLGYVGQVRSLRASDVGAPHARLRYFLTASPGDASLRGRDAARPEVRSGEPAGPARGSGVDALEDCFCELGHECLDCARRRVARREGDGLLPTPTARDWKNVGDPTKTATRMADRGQPLGEVVVNALRLIPTPTGRDWRDGGDTGAAVEEKAYLGRAVWDREAWGQYADAIVRWETLTRPAPSPTELNKLGNRRLSPVFVEWMMGLPAGWVTDVPGITRNEALKALGNGVVPQQAAAAIREMLSWAEVAA